MGAVFLRVAGVHWPHCPVCGDLPCSCDSATTTVQAVS